MDHKIDDAVDRSGRAIPPLAKIGALQFAAVRTQDHSEVVCFDRHDKTRSSAPLRLLILPMAVEGKSV